MTDSYLMPITDFNAIDLEDLLEQDPMLLKMLAAKQDVPPAVLARLACHSNYEIKTAVARNANTPPEVLEVLSEQIITDRYGDIIDTRCAQEATANPSTPASALARIVRQDISGHVNALRNENTPLESILSYMLDHVGADEKAALGFNKRFSNLIRIATKLDTAHEAKKQSNKDESDFDFDVDTDEVIEVWRS